MANAALYVALILGAATALMIVRLGIGVVRLFRRRGRCAACGYSRVGATSERCTECGAAADLARRRARRRLARQSIATVLVGALLAGAIDLRVRGVRALPDVLLLTFMPPRTHVPTSEETDPLRLELIRRLELEPEHSARSRSLVVRQFDRLARRDALVTTRSRWPRDRPVRARLVDTDQGPASVVQCLLAADDFLLVAGGADRTACVVQLSPCGSSLGIVGLTLRAPTWRVPAWRDPTFEIGDEWFEDDRVALTVLVAPYPSRVEYLDEYQRREREIGPMEPDGERLLRVRDEARAEVARRHALSTHEVELHVERVDTIDEAITPVRAEALTAAVDRALTVEYAGLRAEVTVDRSLLPPDVALGLSIRIKHDGATIAETRGVCLERTGLSRAGGRIYSFELEFTMKESRPVQRADEGWVTVIESDPEMALLDFERERYWSGRIVRPFGR